MRRSAISSLTPVNFPLERSLYIGGIIRGILFGMEIFMFFAAVYCVRHRPSRNRKSQKHYVAHGGILLALTTIEVVVDTTWGRLMWIDHRNDPGGPLGFYSASVSTWYCILGVAACAMANILGDGLLVYRCYIIWGPRWYILAPPVLTYLASSVLAIITVVESAQPYTPSLPSGKPIRVIVPWVSLSVSLNVIVTLMICFRLLQMRALTRRAVFTEMSNMYTSIAAMLIESAAPISILGIGLIIIAARNGPVILAFAYIWTMFCSLSPQIIILWVSMGRGCLKETTDEINTALVFAEAPMVRDQSQGVRTTISNGEELISGSGIPTNRSEASIKEQTRSTANLSVVSLA